MLLQRLDRPAGKPARVDPESNFTSKARYLEVVEKEAFLNC
jgi:hypothetical protein